MFLATESSLQSQEWSLNVIVYLSIWNGTVFLLTCRVIKKMLAISVNHVLKTLTIPDILKNINVYIMKRDPMTVNNVIKP